MNVPSIGTGIFTAPVGGHFFPILLVLPAFWLRTVRAPIMVAAGLLHASYLCGTLAADSKGITPEKR